MGVFQQLKKKIADNKNNKLLQENGIIMYKLANILQLIDELRFDKENNHNKISYMEEEKLDENIRQLEIKFRILTEEQKWIQDRLERCKN